MGLAKSNIIFSLKQESKTYHNLVEKVETCQILVNEVKTVFEYLDPGRSLFSTSININQKQRISIKQTEICSAVLLSSLSLIRQTVLLSIKTGFRV